MEIRIDFKNFRYTEYYDNYCELFQTILTLNFKISKSNIQEYYYLYIYDYNQFTYVSSVELENSSEIYFNYYSGES